MSEADKSFWILVVGTILIFTLIISFAVWESNSSIDNRISTCKNIGSKLNLDYYGTGYCGWESECSYTCKFIDQNGDTVIRNVK